MPTKCSVSGCENFYSRHVPFFDLPSPLKYKFSSEKAALAKRRRKRWLDAIGITGDSSEVLRICTKHFLSGKPATLEDYKNVDWVPTLHVNLGSSHNYRKKYVEDGRRKKFKSSSQESRLRNKIDLKKFNHCKVLLNGNIQCTTFKGTNGSGLTIAQEYGYFTSDNVMVKEAAINNTVLRIHLIREDLQDLKQTYKTLYDHTPSTKRRREEGVSSFGRQLKKKKYSPQDGNDNTPFKKSVSNRTVESTKNSLLGKTDKQMRNRSEKEDKNTAVNSKFQSKHEFMKNISEGSKTLNKIINRNYRDKIKIRLFPKTSTPIRRAVKNGRLIGNKSSFHNEVLFVKKNKNEPQQYKLDKTYFLKFSCCRCPEDGTLDYSFQKLVTDVKHLKLPAPSWKIKVNIKQRKISAITFTNKLQVERSVGFYANGDQYKITIDNKPALLLGSPNHIRTSADLEILLDIIQNIDSNNPMIFYK